jgi:hypothetical protein
MSMNQKLLDKMIGKMMNIIKPIDVSKIVYELKPIDDVGQEYYMGVTYIVPDDSIILKSRNLINQTKSIWNKEIIRTIKNYYDVDIIINSSGTQSESYYNRKKQYE